MMLALVAAGAGACGQSGQSAASATCDSPGVSANEIRLGLLYPDTGPTATAVAAGRAGVDARIGLANAKGGINGRKIVYEWRDDKDNPTTNATGARNLIEQQNVFGVLEFSFVANGSAQYLADKGIPVGGLSIGDAWSKHPNMFSIGATTVSAIDLFGNFLKSEGATRAAVVGTALSAGTGDVTAVMTRSIQAAGISVVDSIGYTAGADNPATVAQRVAASGADTLMLLVSGSDLPTILTAVRAAAPKVRVIMSLAGYDRQLLAQAGPAMAGTVIPVFYRPFEAGGPAIDTFRQAMVTYAPQFPNPEQQLALISYIDTDLFLRGIEAAGPCPTRQAFMTGLRAVTNYDAGGLIAPLNIARDLGRQITCWSFVQVNPAGNAFGVLRDSQCGQELPAAPGAG
ncbi:ABC-type branched-chain amino acid transport system, periplasmic component [Frankia canadensis]|uniref:ABC-type branched-chain amino acid transport system, periplasmic component n=2 Tax=Frankia canadensis TaxID=1836972 RepID=A0A2I2KQQ5_9ACTN|nr:ABC-type branched-chain amino acid transport system, periplasmic component [Frankia canadensis]SOU55256.1 ABC-type branched-chain amino acid transport system, periplasmic component [Frankia canadensis]